MPNYVFSADRARLDADWVHRQLSENAYWALGRARDAQEAANAGSRCYGMYAEETGAQVAFARVVTDGATFGWLCDVIVDSSVRGDGVGKTLMAEIMADLEPLALPRVLLATSDAHGLYERHGFAPLVAPEKWMLRPSLT